MDGLKKNLLRLAVPTVFFIMMIPMIPTAEGNEFRLEGLVRPTFQFIDLELDADRPEYS